MRQQVVTALTSLADALHQRTVWGRYLTSDNYYDDLTLNLHILYDDCMVLPEPQAVVGDVLHQRESDAFQQLQAVLGPIVRELGDSPDIAYIDDPRWPAVIAAAANALTVVRQTDDASGE